MVIMLEFVHAYSFLVFNVNASLVCDQFINNTVYQDTYIPPSTIKELTLNLCNTYVHMYVCTRDNMIYNFLCHMYVMENTYIMSSHLC